MTVLSLTWDSPYLGETVFILRPDPDGVPIHHCCWIISLPGIIDDGISEEIIP